MKCYRCPELRVLAMSWLNAAPSNRYPKPSPALSEGGGHGCDVLRGDVGEDVVNLLEDESSTGAQFLDLLPGMAKDLVRSPLREDSVGIATPSPEGDLPSEVCFQFGSRHPRTGDLDRVDGIQAGLDQVGQQRADSPAAVEHHFDIGQRFGAIPEERMPGLEELTVHGR